MVPLELSQHAIPFMLMAPDGYQNAGVAQVRARDDMGDGQCRQIKCGWVKKPIQHLADFAA
jgi:hypothetical protein